MQSLLHSHSSKTEGNLAEDEDKEKEAEPLGCVVHIVEESFSQEKTETVPANLKGWLCNVIYWVK